MSNTNRMNTPAAPAGTFCPVIPGIPLSSKASILTIPVLPYVGRYLQQQYPGGYRLSESDELGELIFQLLRRPHTKTRNDAFMRRYSARFEVHISQDRLANKGFGKVNSHLIIRVNSFLEARIREKMYDFVDFCKQYRVKKNAPAIRDFMQTNGITEQDIAYETLLKSYQRRCKRKKTPHSK